MNRLQICIQDEPVQAICERDPLMKKLINVIGDIQVDLREDYLSSIVRSIVGQQISVTSASAIYGRLNELLDGNITAEGLNLHSKKDLRQVGLTMRKTDYIKDLAEKAAARELDLKNIAKYNNEAINECKRHR